MERKSTAFSAAIPELIDEYDYAEWAIRMRTYLKAQDLWKDIIDDNGNPIPAFLQQENEHEAINDWRRRNYMALHVIQISCGPDALSKIRTINSSANTAWQILKKKYQLDMGSVNKSYLLYADLYRAVLRGSWPVAEDFLNSQPDAVRQAITYKGETALHIAVAVGHAHIVQELVGRMSREDVGIADGDGYTALMTALVYGRSDQLVQYLYPLTSLNDLVLAEKGRKGAMLLTRTIYTRDLGIRIDPSAPANGIATDPLNIVNIENGQHNQVPPVGSVPRPAVLFRQLVSVIVRNYLLVPAKSIVSKLLGIKQLYDMKKIHKQSEELLSCMCKEISESSQTGQLKNIGVVYDAISRAVKNGISEFVFKIVEMDPSFLGNRYRNSRNILMLAVLYRQSKIFNHIYGLDEKNALTSYGDRNDDNMLHMAGMIEDSTMLNQISGAALQMQRELQWFKQVAGILNPKIIESINRDGLTPQELFAKNHENMIEKGEKWMKDTASSCTVVGALIVTIMFSVAFTVPGGNDQTTGFPIFLKKRLFMFFIIFDALSLSSSSTSVLMFLGILTSRYAEEDFLESLPRKMIIGLLVLFFSIATMMIAFSIALLIMVRDQYSWMVIPIICLACVPVTIFISIQSRLLFKMIKSTYFPGIFNRKIELR
ncbi:uncharacterized protein LOC122293174 isoform X3 [Carya illinoinensis]|uniref:uncharacterized protein LOC122293174 isoform X3 n=1 Tax=Carya illinoinensis TaxID=32201 RepID=UPI001C726E47|nr:uncharacterized protein LOC122293174 isoform X3 [Carya illinoinensis]